MSDFDKEAERRRLREKYEKDREKREQTQRMSELLLKGATMTNRHCDTCGDPIFRWNGQEFCPTCNAGEGDADAAVPADDAADATGEEAGATDIEVGSADADAPTEAGTGGADAGPGEAATDGTPSPTPATSPAATGGTDATPTPGRERSPDAGASAADATGQDAAPRAETGGQTDAVGADLRAVRASLTRTLARHAEAAEAAEDPRRAREHLAAAREAAESLAALRR